MGNPTPETNTAVIQAKPQSIAETGRQSVARYGDDRTLRLEMRAMRGSLPGLANAEDNDVLSLIIASKFSGLNPYAGEIYLIPGKGVMTSSKVKAADAVTAAAKRGDFLVIDYDPVYATMPLGQELGLEAGDVAYLCRIRSSKAEDRWYAQRRALIDELKAMGAQRTEIEQALAERLPKPPDMRAVGIVKAGENFGDANKKAVVFTRADRAKKRALIKCLNANGLSATDQRQYGGVQMAGDEPVEAQYTIRESPSARTPEQVSTDIDPEWAAAVAEVQEGGVDHGAINASKLGRDEPDSLLDSKQSPKKPKPSETPPAERTAKGGREAITAQGKRAAALVKQLTDAGMEYGKLEGMLSEARAALKDGGVPISGLYQVASDLHALCEEAERSLADVIVTDTN